MDFFHLKYYFDVYTLFSMLTILCIKLFNMRDVRFLLMLRRLVQFSNLNQSFFFSALMERNKSYFALEIQSIQQFKIFYKILIVFMVQIQKAEKKAVYRYLLQEGVVVVHKDFTTQPHKGTGLPNINVRMMLRSLKDRGFVELIFSWQYYYYFINNEGKKYLSEFLNLTEEVVPMTWKKDEKRQYEHIIEDRGRRIRRDRQDGDRAPPARGGRGTGGRRDRPNETPKTEEKPAETTTA